MLYRKRNLAKRSGGTVPAKTYCRLFRYRPQRIAETYLCAGSEDCAPCLDFERCSANKPRRPAPVAEYEREDDVKAKHDPG